MPNRYTASHAETAGAGDARPTALQIVQDLSLEHKLAGKVVLITGTSSGIGIETVRAMAATGARVFCTVRNMKKGQEALADILSPGKVELLHSDQSSLKSVQKGTREFLEKSGGKCNIFIANAGVMLSPWTKTEDGFEEQFATCHMAHFLMLIMIRDAMLKSATKEMASRVVMVSSSGHWGSEPLYGNYDFDDGKSYAPGTGYGQAKTANIYMANEIERLYGQHGIHGISLMPGGIVSGLQVHMQKLNPTLVSAMKDNPAISSFIKSSAQGAATTVYAALSPEFEHKAGVYLEDCDVAPPHRDFPDSPVKGHADHAYNPEGEQRLWRDSVKMLQDRGFEVKA